MIEYETGAMCRSLAGHDKDEVYVIIEEAKEYVSLVNGVSRPLAKPKRKKRKHVQIIYNHKEWECRSLIEDGRISDEKIRDMIRIYKRRGQS